MLDVQTDFKNQHSFASCLFIACYFIDVLFCHPGDFVILVIVQLCVVENNKLLFLAEVFCLALLLCWVKAGDVLYRQFKLACTMYVQKHRYSLCRTLSLRTNTRESSTKQNVRGCSSWRARSIEFAVCTHGAELYQDVENYSSRGVVHGWSDVCILNTVYHR